MSHFDALDRPQIEGALDLLEERAYRLKLTDPDLFQIVAMLHLNQARETYELGTRALLLYILSSCGGDVQHAADALDLMLDLPRPRRKA